MQSAWPAPLLHASPASAELVTWAMMAAALLPGPLSEPMILLCFFSCGVVCDVVFVCSLSQSSGRISNGKAGQEKRNGLHRPGSTARFSQTDLRGGFERGEE